MTLKYFLMIELLERTLILDFDLNFDFRVEDTEVVNWSNTSSSIGRGKVFFNMKKNIKNIICNVLYSTTPSSYK